jgi:hypothetical protein
MWHIIGPDLSGPIQLGHRFERVWRMLARACYDEPLDLRQTKTKDAKTRFFVWAASHPPRTLFLCWLDHEPGSIPFVSADRVFALDVQMLNWVSIRSVEGSSSPIDRRPRTGVLRSAITESRKQLVKPGYYRHCLLPRCPVRAVTPTSSEQSEGKSPLDPCHATVSRPRHV